MEGIFESFDLASMLPLMGSVAYFSVGFTLCFKGFKSFKLSLAALFAVLGGYTGFRLFLLLEDQITADNPQIVEFAIIGIVALIFATISYSLYDKAVVILTTFAGCYLFYNGYIDFLGDPSGMSKTKALLIGLGFGLVCGLAIHFIQRIAIKTFTSISGGYLLATGAAPQLITIEPVNEFCSQIYRDIFYGSIIKSEQALLLVALAMLFALFGLASQWKDK